MVHERGAESHTIMPVIDMSDRAPASQLSRVNNVSTQARELLTFVPYFHHNSIFTHGSQHGRIVGEFITLGTLYNDMGIDCMEINDIQSRSRETLVDTGPGGSEPGITRIMTWVLKILM